MSSAPSDTRHRRTGMKSAARTYRKCDNDSLNQHKYVCITTYQPDTKSDTNPNPNHTTKQHAIVNIQLNRLRTVLKVVQESSWVSCEAPFPTGVGSGEGAQNFFFDFST